MRRLSAGTDRKMRRLSEIWSGSEGDVVPEVADDHSVVQTDDPRPDNETAAGQLARPGEVPPYFSIRTPRIEALE